MYKCHGVGLPSETRRGYQIPCMLAAIVSHPIRMKESNQTPLKEQREFKSCAMITRNTDNQLAVTAKTYNPSSQVAEARGSL